MAINMISITIRRSPNQTRMARSTFSFTSELPWIFTTKEIYFNSFGQETNSLSDSEMARDQKIWD